MSTMQFWSKRLTATFGGALSTVSRVSRAVSLSLLKLTYRTTVHRTNRYKLTVTIVRSYESVLGRGCKYGKSSSFAFHDMEVAP